MNKIVKTIVCVFVSVALFCSISVTTPIPVSVLSYKGSSSYKSGKYYTALKKVSLTGNQRKDIVNVAKSQVGYQESSSSHKLSGEVRGNGNKTEYGRWYGLQDMWCAMFVSWSANVAKVSTSIIPKHSFTPTGLNWFKNRGRAYSRAKVAAGKYKPQPGDVIYFKSPRNNNPTNHVGIVTKYSGKTVYTIEGNTSSATVSTNGGAVASKSYSINNTYIVYICKPDYKDSSASDTNVNIKPAVSKIKYFKACSQTQKSIVDALESIGVDSSYVQRRRIAKVNRIKNYSGTVAQNNKMLKLLKRGKLIKSRK